MEILKELYQLRIEIDVTDGVLTLNCQMLGDLNVQFCLVPIKGAPFQPVDFAATQATQQGQEENFVCFTVVFS